MPIIMEGTRPPAGPALPNLINAVLMLKSKSKNRVDFDFDFDFRILTALKGWVGLAPQGRGALQPTGKGTRPKPCPLLDWNQLYYYGVMALQPLLRKLGTIDFPTASLALPATLWSKQSLLLLPVAGFT